MILKQTATATATTTHAELKLRNLQIICCGSAKTCNETTQSRHLAIAQKLSSSSPEIARRLPELVQKLFTRSLNIVQVFVFVPLSGSDQHIAQNLSRNCLEIVTRSSRLYLEISRTSLDIAQALSRRCRDIAYMVSSEICSPSLAIFQNFN